MAAEVGRGQTVSSFMSHVIAIVVLRKFSGVMDSVRWCTKGGHGGVILPQCSWSCFEMGYIYDIKVSFFFN